MTGDIVASSVPDPAIKSAARVSPFAIEYLPIGLFGSVMGLSGLSIAWRLASSHFRMPVWIIAIALLALASIMIAAMSLRTLVGRARGELKTLSA